MQPKGVKEFAWSELKFQKFFPPPQTHCLQGKTELENEVPDTTTNSDVEQASSINLMETEQVQHIQVGEDLIGTGKSAQLFGAVPEENSHVEYKFQDGNSTSMVQNFVSKKFWEHSPSCNQMNCEPWEISSRNIRMVTTEFDESTHGHSESSQPTVKVC